MNAPKTINIIILNTMGLLGFLPQSGPKLGVRSAIKRVSDGH